MGILRLITSLEFLKCRWRIQSTVCTGTCVIIIVLLNWYDLLCTILCVCVINNPWNSLSPPHYMHPLQHQPASLSSYPRPGDGDKEAHCQCHCRAVFWLLHLTTAMVGYCRHCSYTCTLYMYMYMYMHVHWMYLSFAFSLYMYASPSLLPCHTEFMKWRIK